MLYDTEYTPSRTAREVIEEYNRINPKPCKVSLEMRKGKLGCFEWSDIILDKGNPLHSEKYETLLNAEVSGTTWSHGILVIDVY